MSNNLFFLAGFQNCATTWLHRCLEEHPQIFVPNVDMVHYYDMNYHRGRDWYEKFYQSYNQEQMRGDTTVSYARSELAIKRIAKTNSNAKIILSLRNPITRAFSHYWHEKKKGKIKRHRQIKKSPSRQSRGSILRSCPQRHLLRRCTFPPSFRRSWSRRS